MNCEEFQALAAAFALGALDPEERALAEAHLAEPAHRGCEEALRRAYATVGALAVGLPPVAPRDGVWQAIEARLESGAAPSGRRRQPLAWARWAAAAAAALFLVLWLGERRNADRARKEVAAAQQLAQSQGQARAAVEQELAAARATADAQRHVVALLDLPGSRVVILDPVPGHSGRATAIVNLEARQAVIVSASLPPQPGKVYQLWVIRGTAAPAPAGFLQQAEGLFVGRIDPSLLAAAPDALAVSLEVPGGSPAPTDVALVGKMAG